MIIFLVEGIHKEKITWGFFYYTLIKLSHFLSAVETNHKCGRYLKEGKRKASLLFSFTPHYESEVPGNKLHLEFSSLWVPSSRVRIGTAFPINTQPISLFFLMSCCNPACCRCQEEIHFINKAKHLLIIQFILLDSHDQVMGIYFIFLFF